MAMLLKHVGDHRLIDDHRNAEFPYQVVGRDNRTLALLADRVLAEVVLNYLEEDELPLTDDLDVAELRHYEHRLAAWFDMPERKEV